MAIKRFETDDIERVLFKYKQNPSEENLDELYNKIDHIIVTITNRIASGFSHKYPDDFMDLQQNVRISIYRILPKLATISVSGNQVVAIIVKATVWSFKSRYAAYKRKTPVKGTFGVWQPDNDIPIEVQLEMAIGGTELGETSHKTEEEGPSWAHCQNISKVFISPKVWTNSNQYETILLKTLPVQVLNKALQKNRFKDKEDLVRFCLVSLIEGRDASTMLISRKWDVNPSFWTRYSSVLLKLSILEVIR